MIKEVIDTNSKVSITLIYLNHSDNFPFKQDLDEWQKKYPYLKIYYITSAKFGRLTKEKLLQLVPDIRDFVNYVAGFPGMVTSIEDMLLKLGARNEDIKIDSFDGY